MPEIDVKAGMAVTPLVTIVVPVRNGATTIAECVSSLLASQYDRQQFEIVVVDNDSSDPTREILRGFGSEIRVLTERVRGASAARNHGIRDARGALIALTDADCVVEPGWLSALVSPLEDQAVGVVGGRILSREKGNRIEKFGETIHDHRRAIEIEDQPYVISMNWASRREVIQTAGMFDESLLRGQDVDLAWRIHRSGLRLVYAPSAIIRHRNEHTLRGLMQEGYVHGLHGVRLRDRHSPSTTGGLPRRTNIRTRLLRDLREIATGGNWLNGALRLLFDAGRVTGELVAVSRHSTRP